MAFAFNMFSALRLMVLGSSPRHQLPDSAGTSRCALERDPFGAHSPARSLAVPDSGYLQPTALDTGTTWGGFSPLPASPPQRAHADWGVMNPFSLIVSRTVDWQAAGRSATAGSNRNRGGLHIGASRPKRATTETSPGIPIGAWHRSPDARITWLASQGVSRSNVKET
jgi:hypothetical protein